MTHNLLKGKRGIIFGALNEESIAWKVAVKAVEEGAQITLSNTPMALRMGELDALSKQLNAPVIAADATSVEDLEKVFEELTEKDFVFLDPPYDTDFSDYENKSFDKHDQERLSKTLEKTKAKFILIIKNTPFIYNLYNKECFKIKSFDNNYAYCVKNRNNRSVEHLIITNY